MGDTGSLLSGFVLGAGAVEISRIFPAPQGLLCPVLVLGAPCFEAVFVALVRAGKGLPVMRASRDHVAQRLVQMGCSVQGAVVRICAWGALSVLLGVLGAIVGSAMARVIWWQLPA